MDKVKNARIPQLVHDLVIEAHRCNFHCQYCLVAEAPSEFRTDRQELLPKQENPQLLAYEEGSALKRMLDPVLEHYRQVFDAPILKISGGEAFLIAGLDALVARSMNVYESVQILTNGSLFSESTLRRLALLNGVHLQISLDGHRYEMNQLRVASPQHHACLLRNLDEAVHAGLPVEIFCVVHRYNAAALAEFADFLLQRFDGAVGLTPFPVRGAVGMRFVPDAGQDIGLVRLMEEFDRYGQILPAKAYLLAMHEIVFKRQPRQLGCVIPRIMLQSFHDGRVTPCPYSWLEEIGSLANDPDRLAAIFGKTAGYRVRGMNPPRASFCRSCVTDSYPLSLFFAHQITLHELCHNRPILGRPRAKARLLDLQQRFDTARESSRDCA